MIELLERSLKEDKEYQKKHAKFPASHFEQILLEEKYSGELQSHFKFDVQKAFYQ